MKWPRVLVIGDAINWSGAWHTRRANPKEILDYLWQSIKERIQPL